MYLIDTNVLSAMRKRQVDRSLLAWLRGKSGDLHISAITVMEIERGIEQKRRNDPPFALQLETWLRDVLKEMDDHVLPITSEVAQRWGRLQAQLGRKDFDVGIAATALEHSLQVVTANVRHFDKTGVTVINPFANTP